VFCCHFYFNQNDRDVNEGAAVDDTDDLERFRSYLLLLAQLHPGGQDGASDVVQQTLLEAFQQREQFRGGSDAERAAWLRRALANNLADAHRARHRHKRDVSREIDVSASRLGELLAADVPSPSAAVRRDEDALLLAAALEQLPEPQREAIVLQHWHGLTLAQIGERLDKTPVAVAGLLKRGLKRLREILEGRAQSEDR
jgi:RNA polymerase sigma-70 factor (ECF subfamily)